MKIKRILFPCLLLVLLFLCQVVESCEPGEEDNTMYGGCRYCSKGHYNPYSWGQCKTCPFGYWNDDTGAKSIVYCRKCPEATYTETVGSISMWNCTCIKHAVPKSATSDGTNHPGCACRPGFFYRSWKFAQDSEQPYESCERCKEGFYKSSVGNFDCIECPSNSESTESRERCSCPDNYYDSYTADGIYDGCQPCPENAKCEEGGIFALPGYWHGEEADDIYECQIPAACSDDGCGTGYEGRICSVCAENYCRAIDGECYGCADGPKYLMLFLVVVPLLLLGLAYVYYAAVSRLLVPLYTAVSCVQCLSLLNLSPTGVMRYVGLLSLDPTALLFVGTHLSFAYPTIWFLSLVSPLVVAVLLVLGWALARLVVQLRAKSDPAAKQALSSNWISFFVVVLLILHFVSTKAAFAAFACTKVGDKRVMNVYPELVCFESTHLAMFTAAVTVAVCFTLFFVVLLAASLARHPRIPAKLRVERLVFLGLPFDEARAHWPAVLAARSVLTLTVYYALVSHPKIRSFSLMLLFGLYRFAHNRVAPYSLAAVNTLESLGLYCLSGLFLLQLLVLSYSGDFGSFASVLVLLALITGAVAALFIFLREKLLVGGKAGDKCAASMESIAVALQPKK